MVNGELHDHAGGPLVDFIPCQQELQRLHWKMLDHFKITNDRRSTAIRESRGYRTSEVIIADAEGWAIQRLLSDERNR